MQPERYLITRPFPGSGIGSNLLSFAGAVWLAGKLGRTVIVDWRGSNFLQDRSVNLFSEFYEPVPEIQGVRVLYAPTEEAGEDDAPAEASEEIKPWQGTELIASGPETPFLVLTQFHGYERVEPSGNPLEQFKRLREFYRFIRPRPFLQEEIDRFASEHGFDDTFVVAVNIATGNGENAKGSPHAGRVRIEVFDDEHRFLGKILSARRKALRGVPPYMREGALTFVATDAAFMRERLLRLPNAVTRRAVFPPPGAGRGFADYDVPGYTDRDALVDILVDHHLLARCNAIIRNPSLYASYGTAVTTFYNGNMRNLETLYAKYRIAAVRRRARALLRR